MSAPTLPPVSPAVKSLRSSQAVRKRCRLVYDFVASGKSSYFTLDVSALPKLAALVAEVTRASYPTLEIPYHSRFGHFSPPGEGGRRTAGLKDLLAKRTPVERGKSLYDLIVVSVLLDAGAGMAWKYRDEKGFCIGRSEGLALASFDAFMRGVFSSHAEDPLRVDAERLKKLTTHDLEALFQVDAHNPMTGLEGRVQLLKSLGSALHSIGGRPGGLFEKLLTQVTSQRLPATAILSQILETLSPIWPGRLELHGHNLGDVWRHPGVVTNDETTQLVPFHKLSQWLSYSLIEPLEWHGIEVTGLDELTGLAEYRNGGLFLDGGAIVPRSQEILTKAWNVGDIPIVEWRALTVSLLDEIAPLVRSALGSNQNAAFTPTTMPLAKILQGGTWAAGRRLAAERRSDSGPPIKVISDGTVF